ncbi:MAG: threonine synthase [Vicinamibacterales bacterium]
MLQRFSLDCGWCGERQASSYSGARCERCNGPLKVNVDLGLINPAGSLRDQTMPGLWAWFDLLPISDRGAIVSLDEGNTPLVPAPRLAKRLGLETLLLKDETRNPTGSFKDRMLSVGVSRAVELGKNTVAVQSSGNVGAAAAAYATRAGLRAVVFVPRTAPEEKLLQAQMYGADVIRIDHDSPAEIFDLLLWAAGEFGWYLVSTAAIYNPFTLEGAKTIAYEIAEQTTFDLPDWVIVPVGGGGAIGSLWRGFLDLQSLGLVDRLPRMAGVQAEGCAPFVQAIRVGWSPQEALGRRWPKIDTVAGAIADDVVFDAHVALPAVRESGGAAVAVPDEATLAMQKALAADEGIFVEPTGATTLAAVNTLVTGGRIPPEDRVVCLLTGSGLKDLGAARWVAREIGSIPLDRDALVKHVRG